MKKILFILVLLFMFPIFVACTAPEPAPLPTLVPLAQPPEITPSISADPTEDLQINESSEADSSQQSEPSIPEQGTDAQDDTLEIISEGRIIYFNKSGDGIFVANPNGTNNTQIYDLHQISRLFAKSNKGNQIALVNDNRLYIANLDGSNINEMPGGNQIIQLSWSPNGTHFAFIQNGDVYITDVDEDNSKQVTMNLELTKFHFNLAWSPDSQSLIIPCNQDASDICLLNLNNISQLVNLTNESGLTWFREPTWSPDGTQISFVSRDENGNLHIFTMNPDGTRIEQLTKGTGRNIFHDWSPNSTQIVYSSQTNDGWQALIMGRDGTGKRSITESLISINSVYPLWSPNGERISLYYTEDSSPDEFSIFINDTSSTDSINITGNAQWASWSPDGDFIAFLTNGSEIIIVDKDGNSSESLLKCVEACAYFEWIP